jgi:glutathione S-transferase
MALTEKGVSFEQHLPEKFGTGATTDRGFIERNPRHEVPALVDGDVRIFDQPINR